MYIDIPFYEKFFKEPKTKAELKQYWNCSMRRVRQNISMLQEFLDIVNMQDGKGYYIPEKKSDISAYAKQEYSRGLKSIAKAYRMFKRCGIDGQKDLVEVFEDIKKEVI